MPITNSVVYCPGKDKEFQGLTSSMIYSIPNMHDTAFWGGAGGLGQVANTAKLYVMSHSHYFFSKFCVNGWTWTAEEIADMLVNDGLSTNHKDIELLVCCAGLSTVSKSMSKKMSEAARKYKEAAQRDDEKAKKKYEKEYEKLWEQADVPREYTSSNQCLPLACELMQKMKERNFNKLQITSYKGGIASVFYENTLWLDLAFAGLGYGVKASNYPDRKIVWK